MEYPIPHSVEHEPSFQQLRDVLGCHKLIRGTVDEEVHLAYEPDRHGMAEEGEQEEE